MCREDVVFVSNQNYETTYDAICRSGKPLHLDGASQRSRVEGRLESFLAKMEVCHSTSSPDSGYLVEGELCNVCKQEAHALGSPLPNFKTR